MLITVCMLLFFMRKKSLLRSWLEKRFSELKYVSKITVFDLIIFHDEWNLCNIFYIQFMTQYHSYGVTMSDNQEAKLARAFIDKSPTILRLSNDELQVSDELMLRHNSKILRKQWPLVKVLMTGYQRQIRQVARKEGPLFSTLLIAALYSQLGQR